MTTILIKVIEGDGEITTVQASTFPGAPQGTIAELLQEVAQIIKAYESGDSELWYSEKENVNLIDRRKVWCVPECSPNPPV